MTALAEARTDAAAFAGFYREYALRIAVFFTRRTFDVEAARDLTAETFAQAFESRRRFKGSSDAEAIAWLYGIARHQLSHYTRAGVARQKAVKRLGIALQPISTDDHDRIVELAGLADMRQRIQAAFAELTPDQRDALHLRVIDDRPYPEIARRLGVSEPTARARVSRALRTMAAAIDSPGAREAES
jgi:RNA polymerase sigma-70 factor (ECF subfamily)